MNRTEVIEKFELLDDGLVLIKTNKRSYTRKQRTSTNDVDYVIFKQREYKRKDWLIYN